MSDDRLFHRSYGLSYSKYIDSKTKRIIDSIMISLFESGIYDYFEQRNFAKRLDIEEDNTTEAISLSFFKKMMYSAIYIISLILICLIIEILLSLYKTERIKLKNIFLQTVTGVTILFCRCCSLFVLVTHLFTMFSQWICILVRNVFSRSLVTLNRLIRIPISQKPIVPKSILPKSNNPKFSFHNHFAQKHLST